MYNNRFFPISKMKLLLRGAAQIVQVVNNGQQCLPGDSMKKLAILENSSGLSIVVDK